MLAKACTLRAPPRHQQQVYTHLQSSADISFSLPGASPLHPWQEQAWGPLPSSPASPEPYIRPPTPAMGRAGTCSWPR